MVKKIISIAIFVLLVLASTTVYAETFDSIHIEQVVSNMPELKAFFYLVDVEGDVVKDFDPKAEEVMAILGDKQIEIKNIEKAGNEDVIYYYLLDVSTSVSKEILDAVKEEIKEHISSAADNEKIVVITFGEKVKVVIDGEESASAAKKELDEIKPNERATRLFDGLDKMLTLAQNENEPLCRKIAVLVSDGADLYNGEATEDKVIERVQKENIAIYSMALPNSTQSGKDAMKSFSSKAGGKLFSLNYSMVSKEFDKLKERIDSCFVLEMQTQNNIIKSVTDELVLKIPYKETVLEATYLVSTTNWIKDETAPYITSCESDSLSKIAVKFSENVSGADKISSYKIYNPEQDVKYEIVTVSYDEENNMSTIIVNENLYNGHYIIELNGITDVSMESNAVESGSFEFDIFEEDREKPLTFAEKCIKYWYIVVTILIIISLAALFLTKSIKNNKNKKEEYEKVKKEEEQRRMQKMAEDAVIKGINESNRSVNVRINSAHVPSKKVTLVINEEGSLQRSVDAFISGKYTMGRAESCDLSFNDKSMSREHCAFDYINGTLVIKDLNSTNGTIINGIRVDGIYSVNDGDVIKFGKTKITVRF